MAFAVMRLWNKKKGIKMSQSVVGFSEFRTEITPEEYSAFLERQREQSYINDATLKDGIPVSADDYILKGAEILTAVLTGE
jgi:hypothetical protein